MVISGKYYLVTIFIFICGITHSKAVTVFVTVDINWTYIRSFSLGGVANLILNSHPQICVLPASIFKSRNPIVSVVVSIQEIPFWPENWIGIWYVLFSSKENKLLGDYKWIGGMITSWPILITMISFPKYVPGIIPVEIFPIITL